MTTQILLDESTTVQECVDGIADKIGIKNPEEFSLQKEGAGITLLLILRYFSSTFENLFTVHQHLIHLSFITRSPHPFSPPSNPFT